MSTDTRWGIFEWNGSTGAFTNKVSSVIQVQQIYKVASQDFNRCDW